MLEMMIAVGILSLLAGSLTIAVQRMRRMTTSSTARATLQDSAERALRSIARDLSRSGELVIGGVNYPYLFEDGDATGVFAVHAHAPATHHAVAGEPDFGVNREIVFALPQESDLPGSYGNDVPDIDASANMVWDPVVFSYVVVTGPDGVTALQRRSDGANPVTIATNVERVAFDDNLNSGFVLPVNSIRVRLFFRKLDAQGVLHRYGVEQIVKLRNGV
ncbi:MAG TPA: hypothetical protein VM509_14190 [Planctomycetota bacterium]|nr:hypothetical protein [Planctomycetota bacterium]